MIKKQRLNKWAAKLKIPLKVQHKGNNILTVENKTRKRGPRKTKQNEMGKGEFKMLEKSMKDV